MRKFIICLLAFLAVSSLSFSESAARYDIVFILTDDQRFDTVKYMPFTKKFFETQGVNFKNGFVSTPLCCPSRASILTGLYSHNHNIVSNNNGAQKFKDRDNSTIATWLKSAGYRTGLYGKYMNGYDRIYPYRPPGWDEWHPIIKNESLALLAVKFINNTPAGKPMFLYVGTDDPHAPATGAPQDRKKFANMAPWRPPSYNEIDINDKPAWVRKLPKISATQMNKSDAFHRGQLAELQRVDRLVESIVNALNRTGRLNRTIIIFMSDNGLMWGEHRILDQKNCVYEECIRVPFLVRVPGIDAHNDINLVSNIDIAPTIAEWAGVETPTKVNGKSFAQLLHNRSTPWRDVLLIEQLGEVEPERWFYAVRTSRYVYAEYNNSDREFYDLQQDPYQLENAVSNPAYAAIIDELKIRMDDLKDD